MKKADYDAIAGSYDSGRFLSDENIRLWLDPIAAARPSRAGKFRVADFGCGTGRFALPLDKGRTPTLAAVRRWLKSAGFRDPRPMVRDQPTCATAAERRTGLVNKGTSVMTFLSRREHEAGLKRFDRHAAAHPDDPWLLTDRITMISGIKP